MEGKRVRRAEPVGSHRDSAWVSAVTEEVIREERRAFDQFETPVQPRRKNNGLKAACIAAAAVVLVAAGGAAGMGVYANSYDRVFPGVTVGDSDLSGLTYDELEQNLPIAEMLAGTVTVSANGQELGTYSQAQLGASIDTEKLRSEIWEIGREEGTAGWVQNTLTMLKGRAGTETTLEPAVSAYDPQNLRAAAQEMAAEFDREPVNGSYELNQDGLFATKPADGQTLDQEGLVKMLSDLEEGADKVEAPWDPVPAEQLDMAAMTQDLHTEATNARYDTTLNKVVDGEVGISLDVEAAKYVLDAAAPGERVQLPAETVYPQMTAKELEAVLFRDVLSTTTTTVTGSSARKGNVRLSGEACNGTVLNDGEIFNYNQVVGRRTAERGYQAASSYINGQTVDTIGGGICQTSSTVYWAALLANLEIVERYNHGFTVTYVEKGLDATVSWGGPEFRFRNNTGYPIRLDVSYANDKITVTIVGTKTDDTYVKMTSEVLGSTGYKTEYIETTDLAPGVQKQQQSGYTGYQVVTYRNVYDGNGNLISSKQEAKSNYRNRNQIILVGAAKPSSTPEPPASTAPSSDSGITAAPAPAAASDPEPILPETGPTG